MTVGHGSGPPTGRVRSGWVGPRVGAKMGLPVDAASVTNQPHQSPSRPRASPSGMTCLVQCVQRNQISLCDKQLASINTVHLFTTVHQLFQNSHTHTSPSLLSHSSPYHSLSHIHTHSTCPRMFVAPRRQSGVAHYTSPRRPTVNHLPRPRRPSAAVAPTPSVKKSNKYSICRQETGHSSTVIPNDKK